MLEYTLKWLKLVLNLRSKLRTSLPRIKETSKTTTRLLLVSVEVSHSSSLIPSHWNLGAYGEVRKCQHKETKSLRAVKIINKKCLEEEEKKKMLNEI